MRTGLHCSHGGVLADAAGDDDERDVELRFLQHLERPWRAEVGQVVVGKYHLPLRLAKGGSHSVLCFHPLELRLEPPRPQQADQHARVELRVLHHQHS